MMLAHRRDKQLPPLPLGYASHSYEDALAPEPLSIARGGGQGPTAPATELLQRNARLQRVVALQESEISALKQELEQAKLFAQRQSNAITDVLRTTSLAFKRYRELTSETSQHIPASGNHNSH